MKEIVVRRANVILRVPDYQKNEYLAKGFDILDNAGKVAEHSLPSDVNVLKQAYIEHTRLLAQKDREIATLKSDLRALIKAEDKTSAKVEATSGETKSKSTGKAKKS